MPAFRNVRGVRSVHKLTFVDHLEIEVVSSDVRLLVEQVEDVPVVQVG